VDSKTDMKQNLLGLSRSYLTKLRKQTSETLAPSIVAAATGRRPLPRAVAPPKPVTDAPAEDRAPPGKVLKESLQLQKRLRQLTHRLLVAQEEERRKVSHELRDEIAQTLLALNVRLLLLQQAARSKTRGFKKEIASAQRLVIKSASLVRRLARELDHHRPTLTERTVSTI
jgi:signal transduction histidine kinase